MLVAVEEYHLHQQRPRGTRDTMYHEHTVLLACGIFIFIISWKSLNEDAQGLTLRWLCYSSLLLSSSMTSLFCSGIVSPRYTCKRLRQSHRKENGSSISALHTLPPLPHLSPFISLSASRGTWKSYCQNALWLAQSNIVPALSSPGQNESGVAVHDDRIYVVGGYSIWTNEPLACIQVGDVAFRFSLITAVTRQELSDGVIWIQLIYW